MNTLRIMALMMGMLMWAFPSWSQDYNPDSPDEPGVPTTRLVLQASPREGGNVSGAGSYLPGSEVSVWAWPSTGYVFVNWTDADGQVVSTDDSYTLVKGDKKEVLTANFEFRPTGPSEPGDANAYLRYTLSLNATEGGSVSGGGKYVAGTTVTLRASSHAGYVFRHWVNENGEVLSTDSYFSYQTQASNETLTGVFAFNPNSPEEPGDPVLWHNIYVISTEGGSGSCSKSRAQEGTGVYLSANANQGYTFGGWYVDGKLYSDDWGLTYTVQDHDVTFEARFVFSPASPNEPMSPSERMSFYLMSVVGEPGSRVEYPMYFTNLDPVGNMRFDLTFPPEAVPDWSTVRLDDAAAGYDIDIEEGATEGNYTITLTGSTLSPCTLPLLNVMVDIPATTKSGSYPVKINQVSLTTLDDETVTARTRNGRVYAYYLGDANGDGVVTVTDITMIVAYIMEEYLPGFIFEVADVNHDGLITVTDITLTVAIIMEDY